MHFFLHAEGRHNGQYTGIGYVQFREPHNLLEACKGDLCEVIGRNGPRSLRVKPSDREFRIDALWADAQRGERNCRSPKVCPLVDEVARKDFIFSEIDHWGEAPDDYTQGLPV